MKIDFNQPMRNPYGAPVIAENEEQLLLGHVCVNALTTSFQGDKRDGTQKVACWKLSQKLFTIEGEKYHFQEVDIKAKEIALLSDLIEKVYPSPMIYAQAIEMLEPDETKKEEP